MNLATQLEAARRSQVKVPVQAVRRITAGPSSAETLARYRKVMEGKGWVTQQYIEEALGYRPCSSTMYLRKLLDKGLVERRKKVSTKTFPRTNHGYEWRWV